MTEEHKMMAEAGKTRINIRLLILLLAAIVVLAGVLAVGYKVRSRVMTARALAAGKAALDNKDWPEACRQLRVYLEKHSGDVDMLRRYAEANLTVRPRRPENISAAIGAYRELIRHVQGDEDACHKLATLYYAIGDYAETVYICQQRLKVAPGDAVSTVWLGRALIARRKTDEVERLLVEFTRAHPEQIEAFLMLSQMAMVDTSQSSRDAALKWLDQAVMSNPDSAEALARRGRFHFHIGKDRMAAGVDYTKAEELQPQDPRVRLMLAEGWLDLGDLDRAKSQVQLVSELPAEVITAYDINPDDLTFVQIKAKAILALRKFDRKEGIAIAESGLGTLTGDRRILFMPFAAELYLADERIADARKCVEEYRNGVSQAAKQDQAISERLAMLDAAVNLAQGLPYDAIDLLEDLVSRKPLYPQVYRLLWFAYDRTGQRRRGVSSLETYATRQPDDRQARMDLVQGFMSLGASAKALQVARDLEIANPADSQARLLRIQASLRGGTEKVDGASADALVVELRDLCKSDRCNLDAKSMLATLLYARNDVDAAAAELEETVKSCDQALSMALRLVELYSLAGRREQALHTVRSAIERYPKDAEPRIVLADLLLAEDKDKDAELALREAVGQLTGDAKAKAIISLASYLTGHGRPAEACDLLRQAAQDRPRDVDVRLALLDLPLVKQDMADAGRYVEELRKIEGRHGIRWRYEKARLMMRDPDWKKQSEPIAELLRWCMTEDPAWSPPVIELGRMYENLNRDDLAEDVYRRYVDACPERLEVAFRLLDMLERQRRFSESQRVLGRLPQAAPALSGHHVKVAIGQEDYSKAITELEKRLKSHPKDMASRVLLARLIQMARSDTPAALKLLDEAAAVQPDLPSILSSRVAVLHSAGRNDEALSLLDKEAAAHRDLWTLQLRAEYLALIGWNEAAEKAFRDLTSLPDPAGAGYEALARFLEKQDRLSDALGVCEEGLKNAPDSLPLNRLWARLMVLRSDPKSRETVMKRLDKLLSRWPNDANFLTIQASALLAEKDAHSIQRAVEVLDRVVGLQPGFILAHRYLIDLARGRGELQKASQLAARALGANPGNLEFLLIRADLENDLGNTLAAHELAQSVLSIDSRNVLARNLLVRICLQAGENAEAEKYNGEALQIDPGNEDVQATRAEILNLKNRRPEAIRDLNEYVGKQSKPSARVLLALADLYRLQADYANAETRLNQAAVVASDPLPLLVGRLKLLASQRKYDAMLELLGNHLRRYPQESSALSSAVSIFTAVGAADQVRRLKPMLDEFMAANPNRIDGPMIAAVANYATGDFEGTEKAYLRLLQIDPWHQQGLNNLAWVVGVDLGRVEEGLEVASKGVGRYPGDAHLLNTRGVLYYQIGMMNEARKDLERCLRISQHVPTTVARTLLYLGRVSLKQGDMSKAKRTFEQVLDIDRATPALSESERREIGGIVKLGSRPTTRP